MGRSRNTFPYGRRGRFGRPRRAPLPPIVCGGMLQHLPYRVVFSSFFGGLFCLKKIDLHSEQNVGGEFIFTFFDTFPHSRYVVALNVAIPPDKM